MPRSPTLQTRPWELAQRMLQNGAALRPLALVPLGLGMAIYHWAAGLGWAVSFIVIAGAMLAPAIHHVLHRFRVETKDDRGSRP